MSSIYHVKNIAISEKKKIIRMNFIQILAYIYSSINTDNATVW